MDLSAHVGKLGAACLHEEDDLKSKQRRQDDNFGGVNGYIRCRYSSHVTFKVMNKYISMWSSIFRSQLLLNH